MIPQLYQYETLPSTMDEARRMATEGAPEGTIIQSAEQTAGRGRFGNSWASPTGNLYMTIILRPKVVARDIAQMSFATALALADTIERNDVTLKWPNDVLAGGRKVAGILLEMQSGAGAQPDFLLVGVGVNVNSAPPGFASLGETGTQTNVDDVRDAFIENLTHWYQRWTHAGFGDIHKAWMARAHGLHSPITARLANQTLNGVFEGIDAHGNLLLRQNDGQSHAINSAAVHFAPVGPQG